jgi:hypothetical protein
MHPAISKKSVVAALALLAAGAGQAMAAGKANPGETEKGMAFQDWQLTGTFGYGHSSGDYGTSRDTSVDLGLSTLSLSTGDFRFTASLPYMRIDGRGLVLFDASGNPVVVNRRTILPPAVRTGWSDVNFSASYTIPPAILADFEVRISGVAKVPITEARKRLTTGETDLGMSVDVSRQFGKWTPFVTVGYLSVGQPVGYTLYDTTSVSAGSSLEFSENLVATISYDYDTADGPLTPAAQSLFGSLSWVRYNNITLTAYGTAGLSDGSPDMGMGFLISYGVN